MAQMVIHTLAQHEAAMARHEPAVPMSLLVSDLVDCAVAVLDCPPSAESKRELARARRQAKGA